MRELTSVVQELHLTVKEMRDNNVDMGSQWVKIATVALPICQTKCSTKIDGGLKEVVRFPF